MREHDTFSQQIKTTVSLRQEPQSPCIFRFRLQFRNRLLLLGERDVAGLEGQFVDAKVVVVEFLRIGPFASDDLGKLLELP